MRRLLAVLEDLLQFLLRLLSLVSILLVLSVLKLNANVGTDGGTESIAITAGETKNPTKNMPRVVKNVFWRIMIFYIISVLLIGLNVP